jgi:hypothetical protein
MATDNIAALLEGATIKTKNQKMGNLFSIPSEYSTIPILFGNTGVSNKLELGQYENSTTSANFTFEGQPQVPVDYENGRIIVNQSFKMTELVTGFGVPIRYEVASIDEQYDLDPFEVVEMLIVENNHGAGLEKGTIMVVPAFYTLLFKQAIENDKFRLRMEKIEPIIDFAATALLIYITIETAGTGTLEAQAAIQSAKLIAMGGTASVIFHLTDAWVQIEQNSSDDPNSDAYQVWNTLDDAVGLYEVYHLVKALPSLAKGAYKVGDHLFRRATYFKFSIMVKRLLAKPKAILMYHFKTNTLLLNWLKNLNAADDAILIAKMRQLDNIKLVRFIDDFNDAEKLASLVDDISVFDNWLLGLKVGPIGTIPDDFPNLLKITDNGATRVVSYVDDIPGATRIDDPALDNITQVEVNGTTFDIPTGEHKVEYWKLDGVIYGKIPSFCFVAGTDIKISENTTKNIEDIKLNDEVMSFDHNLSKSVKSRVVNLFKRTCDTLAKVTLGGAVFLSSINHPFYANGEYISAGNLHVGDSVLTLNNEYKYIEGLELIDTTVTVYNFEVENNHNYFIGEQGILVHNDCKMLYLSDVFKNLSATKKANLARYQSVVMNFEGAERIALNRELAKLDNTQIVSFLDDFASDAANIVDKLESFRVKPKLIDAWASVKKYHPDLAKDIPSLQSFNRLKQNPSFGKMGLSDESIAKISGYGNSTRSASYKEILDDLNSLGVFLHNNPSTTIQNFDQTIAILKGSNNNYKQGVHWMIKDVNTNGSTFANKSLIFENPIPNARSTQGNSYIDLFCPNCTPANLKVEYKSGPGSIKSSTIKNQFIERDLFNANSLDEIQWRMDGTDFTADKLKTWLKENVSSLNDVKNRSNVSREKFVDWFDLDDVNSPIQNTHIDDFVNDNYSLIFR